MPKRAFPALLLTGLVIGGFAYGLITLLHLRYSAGDIYPPYSSLRADPLGTKALYEAVRDVDGPTAIRSYQPASKQRDLRDVTMLYLGLHPNQFYQVEREEVAALERLLLDGNRVVMAFSPVHREGSAWDVEEDEEADSGGEQAPDAAPEDDSSAEDAEPPPDGEPSEAEEYFDFLVDLPEKWGIELGYTELMLSDDEEPVYEPLEAVLSGNRELPQRLPWHTALYFTPQAGKQWRAVYRAEGRPVVIERQFGPGTLVLCADAYWVSNEALHVDRHADLLAWLLGPHPTIVFNETHLGVMQNPGIATLIRQYRLMWFVGSLIALALLFVWKNTVSFVPPHSVEALTTAERAGKDSLGGLINLLRQNIPPQKLLSACVSEWERSVSHRRQELGSIIQQVRAAADTKAARASRDHNPADTYREMCRIINGDS